MVRDLEGNAILETHLPLPRIAVGKVRDIYGVGSDKLLIITTDRLSAFDVVMPTPVPLKGKVLNQITLFWQNYFRDVIPQHIITADVDEMLLPDEVIKNFRHEIEGRSMLVRKAQPLEIECVVRGYITGSGWKDYQKTGMVCGHKLLPGMKQCEKFPEPLFTPSTKSKAGHDVNIDFGEAIRIVGKDVAMQVRDLTVALYKKGQEYAASRGIIIADTKFEFGICDGEIILIDEILTPDSSGFGPRINMKQATISRVLTSRLSGIIWKRSPGTNGPRDRSFPRILLRKRRRLIVRSLRG